MDEITRNASQVHRDVMISLATWHLLLPVLAFVTGYYRLFISLALIGAVLSIGWIARHAKWQPKKDAFVQQQWRASWQRYRWLLLAYLISTLIICAGYLVSLSQPDHQIEEFMWIAYSRVAIVPTLVTALALFILESKSLIEAKKGD